MNLSTWALAVSLLAAPCVPACAQEKLSALATQVVSADYRGDREALAKLDSLLAGLDGKTLVEYRAYWRGFARWRRALNGFNETPTPVDIGDDLEKAIVHFREALERKPGWIEPRIGIVGCAASQLYLAGKDEAKRQAILAEFVPMVQGVQKDGAENARALWLIGGMQFGAPPPYGGNVPKAVATLGRGLAAAWSESTSKPAPPPWAPAWGGPENLMNLAYVRSHEATPNKDAALAYAQGALTAAPEWHYVRDILLPQIQKLPDAPVAR
jgi:hypothetical protein